MPDSLTTISSAATSQLLPIKGEGRLKFVEFSIPLDADSFMIQISHPEGVQIKFRLFRLDPNQPQQPGNLSIPDKRFEKLYPFTNFSADDKRLNEYWMEISEKRTANYGAIQVPIVQAQYDIRGNWKCELKYDPSQRQPSVFLTVRKRPLSISSGSTYVLPLHVVFYCRQDNNYERKRDFVTRTLEALKTIYAQVPLRIEYEGIIVKPLDRKYSDKFSDPATEQLVRDNYQEGKISLLVVEDLEVSIPSELGIAGGIPGPQYLEHPHAATLVRLSNLYESTSVARFARVMGHELGHYLGLTHESCEYGLPPGLSENDRISEAGKHMMFYTNVDAGTLISLRQQIIMRYAPIVQLRVPQPSAPKTPISKLKVTIKTGWGIPGFMDGAGTDMSVLFVLKTPDSDQFQSWYLTASLGLPFRRDLFEIGRTDIFTFTDCKLYVEDLKQWAINVYNNTLTRNWGGDAWHFKGISIEINDRVVYSAEPDVYLGNGYKYSYEAAFTNS